MRGTIYIRLKASSETASPISHEPLSPAYIDEMKNLHNLANEVIANQKLLLAEETALFNEKLSVPMDSRLNLRALNVKFLNKFKCQIDDFN